MKRRLFAALLVFISSTLVLAQQLNANPWVKFTSEPGRFSALLPVEPTQQTETTPSDHGDYTTHMFIAKAGSNVYVVAWVDYDASFQFRPDNELDANRDNFIKGLNATLLTSRKLILNGYQALEFTAETTEATFRSRVFIVGKRPYQLVVRTTKGFENKDNATRFFDSFTVKP
jgi:hypothetical protein